MRFTYEMIRYLRDEFCVRVFAFVPQVGVTNHGRLNYGGSAYSMTATYSPIGHIQTIRSSWGGEWGSPEEDITVWPMDVPSITIAANPERENI